MVRERNFAGGGRRKWEKIRAPYREKGKSTGGNEEKLAKREKFKKANYICKGKIRRLVARGRKRGGRHSARGKSGGVRGERGKTKWKMQEGKTHFSLDSGCSGKGNRGRVMEGLASSRKEWRGISIVRREEKGVGGVGETDWQE